MQSCVAPLTADTRIRGSVPERHCSGGDSLGSMTCMAAVLWIGDPALYNTPRTETNDHDGNEKSRAGHWSCARHRACDGEKISDRGFSGGAAGYRRRGAA